VMLQCCEMLDYLGVPYIQSAGEAEAMCAFLNKNHVSNKLLFRCMMIVCETYSVFYASIFLMLHLNTQISFCDLHSLRCASMIIWQC